VCIDIESLRDSSRKRCATMQSKQTLAQWKMCHEKFVKKCEFFTAGAKDSQRHQEVQNHIQICDFMIFVPNKARTKIQRPASVRSGIASVK
jgi:hypothetical protein